MKKIVLILLILNFSLSKSKGQEISLSKPKWTSLRFYVSVLPGFSVHSKDSANVTVAMPIGANFRIYNKRDTGKTFFDFDVAAMPIILNKSDFTSYLKISAGFGFIKENFNSEVHASYLFNFLNFGNMIGGGYDLEAASIPLSIEFVKPVKSKNYYILIGIKVPLSTF